MEPTDVPSRTELVQRAAELVPLLQKHALWAEENRRLHDETVQALTDAGITRMRVPARFGGYESDMRTIVEVIAEIARGDGAMAWTLAVWMQSAWATGLLPDEAQEEIFSSADVRVSGILSPTAMAVPVDGGVVVNGQWSFNTGCLHSTWNINAVLLAKPDGAFEPVMTAIPMSELKIIDDWHTAGLRGTGSVTTVAKDVFVPQVRVLPVTRLPQGKHLSVANADSPVYRVPSVPAASATSGAVALGLARAAKEVFFERLPNRKIAYTNYTKQNEAPITHIQVADATVRIDEAEFHIHRIADRLDRKAAANEEWTLLERAGARLDLGAGSQRAKEAVDILNTASGASSMYQDVPIQRIERDIQAVTMHAIVHPNTNLELYGRIACGQEPNAPFF